MEKSKVDNNAGAQLRARSGLVKSRATAMAASSSRNLPAQHFESLRTPSPQSPPRAQKTPILKNKKIASKKEILRISTEVRIIPPAN